MVDMIQKCRVCNKAVDFEKWNTTKMDCVKVINYHDTESKENIAYMLCSPECLDFPTNIGCVICDEPCKTDKWFVTVKFANLGNWLSIRTPCSQHCRDIIINHEAQNIELHKVCWHCKNLIHTNPKKCSKCHLAYYCDKNCQQSDWDNGHKKSCQQ